MRVCPLPLLAAVAAAACARGDGGAVPTAPTPIAPAFSTQPVSLIATLGTTARLIAIPTGSTPLTLQWYHNGTPIAGASADTLKIDTVSFADSGSYFATATNSAGTDTSAIAHITVVTPVSATALRQTGGAGTSTQRTYESDSTDESAMLFLNAAVFLAFEPAVIKRGGASSLAASRDVGTNAAVRAASGSRVYVTTGMITSSAPGAAAVFATGALSRVSLTGGLTTTHGAASPLLGASDGGDVIVQGGVLQADSSDAIVVGAPPDATRPVTVKIAGGASVTAGSGVLFRAIAGATATLTLEGETIAGAAIAASPGSRIVLANTQWTGAATGVGVALDSASVWTVSATSSVTTLTGTVIANGAIVNVVGNGFTVTYDATAPENAGLGGRAWPLAGGGMLMPR